jgi:TonB family protein
MNKLLTIFFFTLSLICKGQETKKITIFDIGSYYVEDYYVLNSDKTIRHGEYKKIKSYNGSILENGFYKMGLRDSIWKRYTNGTLSSTGSYRDGEKIGIWKYYAYNGNLEQVYNHSTKELISNTIAETVDSNKFYRVFLEGDTLSTKLEKAPMCIGGLSNQINKNIFYPSEAREKGKTGKVIISFIIDKSGKTRDHKVLKGIGYGCDEEALRIATDYLLYWSPGILNTKPIDIEYILPITFQIAK